MTAIAPPRGDDEYWPDEHDNMPPAWWRMPDDIRLRVRVRVSQIPDFLSTGDLDASLSVDGPLYIDLTHLTVWDTYQPGQRPTRTAYRALTGRFPDLFTTVHHAHHPGTVSLALRLHRRTDPVAAAILAQRHVTLSALGLDPTNPFLLAMP
jgi:hypothetical protein